MTGRIAGVPPDVPADHRGRSGDRVVVVEQAAERVGTGADVEPHRAGGARAERLDLGVDGAVGRVDEVDLARLRRPRCRSGTCASPGRPACQLLPQPPLDTEMRSAAGAPPLQAASTPADIARAAVSAARRTLAPIRYGSDEVGQRQDKHARCRRNRTGSMLTQRSPAGNPWFATSGAGRFGRCPRPAPSVGHADPSARQYSRHTPGGSRMASVAGRRSGPIKWRGKYDKEQIVAPG